MRTLVNFDGAAGVCPLRNYFDPVWGNYNAPYGGKGLMQIEGAKQQIKDILGLPSGEILFTYSSTHCIQILNRFFKLYGEFYNHHSVLSYSTGVRSECAIEIIQLVNPVLGFVFDIKYLSNEIHNRGHYVFCDATAAIGRLPATEIKNACESCDGLFFSGYKFGTMKGIGVLWVKDEDLINSKTAGKWDKSKNTSGNFADFDLCMIDSLEDALEFVCGESYLKNLDEISMKIQDMLFNTYNIGIISCPYDKFDQGYHIIGKVPSITSYYFEKVNARAFQNYAAFGEPQARVLVGLGHSACESASDYHVANGFGIPNNIMENAIRISPDIINDLKQTKQQENFDSINIFFKILDNYLIGYV